MAKILYEIKEIVEPETLRKIKIYEATTEKLKWLLEIENSSYSEREIGIQTDDLFINKEYLFQTSLTLNSNLGENRKLLNNDLESNIFINLIIFFQIIISLLLFISYQRIKATILKNLS